MHSLSKYFVVVLAIMSLGYSRSLWALGKYAPDQGCMVDLTHTPDPAALGFIKAHGLATYPHCPDWTYIRADKLESYYLQGRFSVLHLPVGTLLANGEYSTNSIPDICNGVHDVIIRNMAKELAAWGRPCLVILWAEFNWGGHPFNASGYGNNPALYRQAWIRVWNIFQEEAAVNVAFAFVPGPLTVDPSGANEWQAVYNYYPGDQYVDWIGWDGAGLEELTPGGGNNLNTQYNWFLQNAKIPGTAIPKPMAQFEANYVNNGIGLGRYDCIKEYYRLVKDVYTNIKAVIWYNDSTPNHVGPNGYAYLTTPEDIAAYNQATADNYFLEHVSLALIAPEHSAGFAAGVPEFKWQYLPGVLYTLEYSTDPAFANTSTKKIPYLERAAYRPTENLSAGLWYWRVTARLVANNDIYAVSAVRNFSVSSQNAGLMEGRVTDAVSGDGIMDAQVVLSGGGQTISLDTIGVDGGYRMPNIPPGAYDLTVSRSGYLSSFNSGITVGSGTVVRDIALSPDAGNVGTIIGSVTTAYGEQVGGIELGVIALDSDACLKTTTTGTDGTYSVNYLEGSYRVRITDPRYYTIDSGSVVVNGGASVSVNFVVKKMTDHILMSFEDAKSSFGTLADSTVVELTGGAKIGSQCAKVTFKDNGRLDYCEKAVVNDGTSDFDRFEFWFKGDGSGSKATFYVKEPDGDMWGKDISLANAAWQKATIYLDDLQRINVNHYGDGRLDAGKIYVMGIQEGSCQSSIITNHQAPGRITDLAAAPGASGDVVLNFTAPEYHGPYGNTLSYQVRYGDKPITGQDDFYETAGVIIKTLNAAGGTAATLNLPGLPSNKHYYLAVVVKDSKANASEVSNYSQVTVPEDTSAPATITDLQATNRTGGGCTLNWTAPGDDGQAGQAARYTLKASRAPINTMADFNNALTYAVFSWYPPAASGTMELRPVNIPYYLTQLDQSQSERALVDYVSLVPAVGNHAAQTFVLSKGDIIRKVGLYFARQGNPVSDVKIAIEGTVLVNGELVPDGQELCAEILSAQSIASLEWYRTQEITFTTPSPALTIGAKYALVITQLAPDANNYFKVRLSAHYGDEASSYYPNGKALGYSPWSAFDWYNTGSGQWARYDLYFQIYTVNSFYYFAVTTTDEKGNVSGLSNCARADFAVDNTPPAALDHQITASGPGWLTLNWTAVGDDGMQGMASSYVLKYSPAPITNQYEFNQATAYTCKYPAAPGTAESFTMTGLPAGEIHVAIEALDEVGNHSPFTHNESVIIPGYPTAVFYIDEVTMNIEMAANLLQNPGFEQYENSTVQNWYVGWSNYIDTLTYDGSSSIKYEADAENWNVMYQNIAVNGKSEYNFSMWHKESAGFSAPPCVVVYEYDAAGNILRAYYLSAYEAAVATYWHKFEASFQVLPETAMITLAIYPRGAGIAWFDDIRLTETSTQDIANGDFELVTIAPYSNLVQNPGFEQYQGSTVQNWYVGWPNGIDALTYNSSCIKYEASAENWNVMYQSIAVSGNSEYYFSMRHIESEDFSLPLYVVVYEYDSAGNYINSFYLNSVSPGYYAAEPAPYWHKWDRSFVTQPDTAVISLAIYPRAIGAAWFDDIELAPISSASPDGWVYTPKLALDCSAANNNVIRYVSDVDCWDVLYNSPMLSVGPENRDLRFSFDYQQSAGWQGTPWVVIYEYDFQQNTLAGYYLNTANEIPVSTAWTKWGKNFQVQSETRYIQVTVYPRRSGIMWLDNISLNEANHISNPGFEDGEGNGWSATEGIALDNTTYPSVTMKYSSAAEESGLNFACQPQVSGGKTYNFAMDYIESQTFSQQTSIYILEQNQAGVQTGFHLSYREVPHATTWSRWNKSFTTRADTVNLSLHVFPAGAGTSWYDNFALIEQ